MTTSISFSGIDGAGKSTVVNLMSEHLLKNQMNVSNYHFRYFILPNRNLKEDSNPFRYLDNEDEQKKSLSVLCLLRVLYISLDYLIGWLVHGFSFGSKKKIVLFDRYKYDLVISPKRIGIFLPSWVMKLAFLLIPDCDYNIFLVGDPDLIISRKAEAPRSEIIRQEKLLNKYANKSKKCLIIDISDKTPIEIVNIVNIWVFGKSLTNNAANIFNN